MEQFDSPLTTQEEKDAMLEALGFASETEARGAAVLAYEAAWGAIDGALSAYAERLMKVKVDGAVAFAVWDYVLREAVAQHEVVRQCIADDEEAA